MPAIVPPVPRPQVLRILAPAMLLLPLISGCVAVGHSYEGNPISRDVLDRIEVGRTTRAEVLELLGAPLAVERVDVTGLTERLLARIDGDELALKLDPALFDELYIYRRTQTYRFGVFLGVYTRITSDQRSDRLTILFDPEGVVLGVGWTPGTDDL